MRQKGFALTLYLYVGAAIAICLALWYTYQTIDKRGYERGSLEIKAAYQKRDNDALQAANKEIQRLNGMYRKQERDIAAQVIEIQGKHAKESASAKTRIDELNRRISAGERLRDPFGRSSAPSSGERSLPGTSANAGGTAPAQGCELSEQASRFLVGESDRADQVVRDYNALLAVCEAGRKK